MESMVYSRKWNYISPFMVHVLHISWAPHNEGRTNEQLILTKGGARGLFRSSDEYERFGDVCVYCSYIFLYIAGI